MVDGAASLMAMPYALMHAGLWRDQRGANLLDGGSHFYGAYQCADGRWVAIGAIEPQFHAELLRRLEIDDPEFDRPYDPAQWESLRGKLAGRIAQKTRDEWREILEGSDACFAPVLDMTEAADHPHIRARGSLVEHEGAIQPAPAPRFSLTPGAIQGGTPAVGQHDREVLRDWGFSQSEVDALRAAGGIVG
jgi:alpha-methylacyl-CoA racemase